MLDTPDKSCKNTNWLTPPRITDPIRAYFELAINTSSIPFDAATSESNPLDADLFCTPVGLHRKDDGKSRLIKASENGGLGVPWSGGSWFVNPPFGKILPTWCAKIADAGLYSRHGIALLPCGARFSTRYFQATILTSGLKVVTFVKGRVAFIDSATGKVAKDNIYDSAIYGYGLDLDLDHWKRTLGQLGATAKVQIISHAPVAPPRAKKVKAARTASPIAGSGKAARKAKAKE